MLHSPSQEYRSRLDARRKALDSLNRIDERLSYARLATFGSSVLLAILAWLFDIGLWWLLVPGVVFVWLVRRHDRVLRARNDAQRGIAFYERGLARIESRWPGTGEPGDRFRDDRHVYANDLDLFGRGSLFELLSLARTRSGEEVLAGWLKSPAGVSEIRERQEAVDELAPALDLRERIALAGTDVRAAVHTDRLLDWAESPLPGRRALFVLTWLLTAAALVAIAYAALGLALWPLGAVVLMQAAVFRVLRDEMHAIVSGADRSDTADFVGDALTHRVRDLDVVADVLRCLELEQFRSSRLAWLRGRLTLEGLPASRVILRLHRLSEMRESTRNAVVLPLGLFLVRQLELALAAASVLALVGPHLALAVDGWRRQHGTKVRGWLDTVAQFEALSSLASYRYEHAADPFPELLPAGEAATLHAVFEGIQLGHPLLPDASMVRNDVRLSAGTQLLVVSGSNMSGKSTLLRTVGVNAVLALAGAPVRAASLRMTPLSIGATLRIQDSLIEGRSRFYAEITRIRELADISRRSVPLLFLLDELFHGTNSHDRLVGAAGVLRSFLDRGAAGLITTHDLALTAVADELAPRAANVHFEDWLEGNEIRFDYTMKSGPVTRSNAIALMRAVGLDVPGQGG